jgi:hypothetical protein
MKKVSEFEANLRLAHVITTKNYKDYDMTDQPRGPRKIQRYFTKQDFLDGLCDASGRPIPGGPTEPPKRDIKDSVPTKAQQALNPNAGQPEPAHVPPSQQPGFDPMKVDAKPAETGVNVDVPADD